MTHRLISLAPHKPAGFELMYSYGAIGVDPQDRVYALYCSDSFPADCALMQYDSNTDKVRLLGTLRQAASNAGNLGPNAHWGKTEQLVKGHTHLPYLKGKIFIGTQEFHDIVGDVSVRFNYRGSHIFAYDIASDTLSDLSASQPKGVFQEHQGLIALTALPERGLVVGFSHPLGDLVLYDVDQNTASVVPGISSEQGNSVAREVVATPSGKLLFSYRFGGGPVYMHDLNSGQTQTTSVVTQDGFWNGQARSKDGKRIYISTYGNLYAVDGASGAVTHLGPTLPAAEYNAGKRATLLWGLSMSLDEQKLYWIPSRVSSGSAHGLYEYDTVSGQTSKLLDLGGALAGRLVSGSNARDSKGRIYFLCHNGSSAGAALLQVDVSSRSGPAPVAPADAGPAVSPDAQAWPTTEADAAGADPAQDACALGPVASEPGLADAGVGSAARVRGPGGVLAGGCSWSGPLAVPGAGGLALLLLLLALLGAAGLRATAARGR